MSAHRVRVFLITTHRYLGLTIGVLIAILGLSGSVAVMWNEATQRVEPGVQHAPLQRIMDALHAAHPDRRDGWAIDFPYRENPHSPAWAVYEYPEERAGVYESPLYVAVSPYTGGIMGQFYWGSTPVSWIFNLHTTLQLGERGESVVEVVGIVFLLMGLSGLYLWWPIGRFSRAHFAMIPGAKGGALNSTCTSCSASIRRS